MDESQIKIILNKLGQGLPPQSRLVLIGGGALTLLGNHRTTIDIDFLGDDIDPSDLDKAIMQFAEKQKILMEPVPLHRFIPIPEGSDDRTIQVGQFGNMEVFVADPYSIAISKLDRGFDTDIDDIFFLINNNFIEISLLVKMVNVALVNAREYDLNSNDILSRIKKIQTRLS